MHTQDQSRSNNNIQDNELGPPTLQLRRGEGGDLFMNGMNQFMIGAILVGIVAAWGIWVFSGVQDRHLRSSAMAQCAQAAANASEGGAFNGAVYKICVEDSGYATSIQ